MILSPTDLLLVRARRKTRLTIPAMVKCPFTVGRVYRARSRNAGWTAAELREHRLWAAEEYSSHARAVLAYLDEPLDASYGEQRPVDVTVLEVRGQLLGDINVQDVRREGFRFVQQFRNRWESTYGVWEPQGFCWAVFFEVGDHRGLFDQVRLLRATPGHAGDDVEEHQDYTSRSALAMAGEPEAIGARDLERYVRQAREHDRLRAHVKRAHEPLGERVRELTRQAKAGNRDAQRALFVIRQRVERAERAAEAVTSEPTSTMASGSPLAQ